MLVRILSTLAAAALLVPAQANSGAQTLARDLFRQLIETNTSVSGGGTAGAANAMAKRLRDAGYPAADVFVGGPNAQNLNLVARLHGTGAQAPVLLIGHLDVVEARRADWTTDPYQLVEKDGYFYGRGTQDMKDGDADYMAAMIRLKQENFHPTRDIIMALTADEEGGANNGVDWLLKNHRDLINAAFVINADGGGVVSIKGKPQFMEVEASEKVYADFLLTVHNHGGHSSLPVADNAIYHLADGLARLQQYHFPVELNPVTRGFFEAKSHLDTGQRAADERAVLQTPPDPAALERLQSDALLNAMLRTTCVATRLSAGVANNALPQTAQALVNCRILPGHSPAEVQRDLARVLADTQIGIEHMDNGGHLSPEAPAAVGPPPVAIRPDVMTLLTGLTQQMWPGIPVVPTMETGATDGKYTNAAGIPTYAFCGMALDQDDVRAHGKDERVGIKQFDDSATFTYNLLHRLGTP